MATVAVKVDPAELRELSATLRALSEGQQKQLSQSILEAVRGLGVQLSAATFPKTEAAGQTTVKQDIYSVFYSTSAAYLHLRHHDSIETASKFWALARQDRSRPGKPLQDLLAHSSLAGADFGQVDSSLHQAARTGPRRRVKLRPGSPRRLLPHGERRLRAYTRKVQRRVGLAKAGWARALKDLRLRSRGIPKWAGTGRHRKARGSGVFQGKDTANPSIELTNHTPWINSVLNESGRRHALKVTRQRLVKRHQIASAKRLAKDNRKGNVEVRSGVRPR